MEITLDFSLDRVVATTITSILMVNVRSNFTVNAFNRSFCDHFHVDKLWWSFVVFFFNFLSRHYYFYFSLIVQQSQLVDRKQIESEDACTSFVILYCKILLEKLLRTMFSLI